MVLTNPPHLTPLPSPPGDDFNNPWNCRRNPKSYKCDSGTGHELLFNQTYRQMVVGVDPAAIGPYAECNPPFNGTWGKGGVGGSRAVGRGCRAGGGGALAAPPPPPDRSRLIPPPQRPVRVPLPQPSPGALKGVHFGRGPAVRLDHRRCARAGRPARVWEGPPAADQPDPGAVLERPVTCGTSSPRHLQHWHLLLPLPTAKSISIPTARPYHIA